MYTKLYKVRWALRYITLLYYIKKLKYDLTITAKISDRNSFYTEYIFIFELYKHPKLSIFQK